MPGRGFGNGRGYGRGRGRQGRHTLLQARMLEPVLLSLLQDNSEHGYNLLEKLDVYGLGTIDPSILYRMLRQMEEYGWVSSTWDNDKTQGPPRRMYQLTDEGYQKLAEWRKELTHIRGMIDDLLKEIK